MRAGLVVCSLAIAATGCRHRAAPPFAAPERVFEAHAVVEVTADARGVACAAAGNGFNRHDSKVYAVDPAGEPTTLGDELANPRHPLLVDRDVYFLTDTGVQRVLRTGGRPRQLFAVAHPTALARAGDELLVAFHDAVLAYSPSGAARALAAGAGTADDLAADDQHVFWIDRAAGRVMRVDRTGAHPTALAEHQAEPVALAVAGADVVWITRGDPATDTEATVAAVPAAGGEVRILHRGDYQYHAVAIDGGWVYWTAGAIWSTVSRVKLAGGPAQVVVDGARDLAGLAVDTGGLWIGAADGLYRARRR